MSARFRLPLPDTVPVAAAWLLLMAPGQALAEPCAVELSPPVSETSGYDPFGAGLSGSITLTAANHGDRDCSADLLLTDRNGAVLRTLRLGAYEVALRLQLDSGPGVVAQQDEAGARVTVPAGHEPVTVRWQVYGLGSLILPPGDFVTEIAVQGGTVPALGTFAVHSPARANANFAGGSPSQTIELGELHPGKTGSALLQVRANTRPVLSFTSQNHGMLRNLAVPGAEIPYRLTFDGLPIDLTGNWRRAVDVPLTLQGQSFRLEVIVGQFTGALAGTYRDDVMIDISP